MYRPSEKKTNANTVENAGCVETTLADTGFRGAEWCLMVPKPPEVPKTGHCTRRVRAPARGPQTGDTLCFGQYRIFEIRDIRAKGKSDLRMNKAITLSVGE